VGVLVANRKPWNPIGWILLMLAIGVMVSADAGFYGVTAYRVDHHGLLLSRLAVALTGSWIAFALLPLPILLFPDGRVRGSGWRWTLWVYLALTGSVAVGNGAGESAAFTDRQVTVDSSGELTQLGGSAKGVFADLALAAFAVLALISLSWVIRQLVRYRRSMGDDRQQLKWLMSGGASTTPGRNPGIPWPPSVPSQLPRYHSRSGWGSSSTGCTRSTG
jgi:hypothetical protein